MQYYSLSYKDGLNPPGNQRMWRIKISSSARNDHGLLEHEKLHVRQWWYCVIGTIVAASTLGHFVIAELYGIGLTAPWVQHALYRIKAIRIQMELACYKAQLRYGYQNGQPYSSAEFAVRAMVRHGMEESDAQKALENDK
jgi:hypothetical protein